MAHPLLLQEGEGQAVEQSSLSDDNNDANGVAATPLCAQLFLFRRRHCWQCEHR